MAQFFALLLSFLQAPAAPPQLSFDARWATAFETLPAATPGFDATTAYVPLKGTPGADGKPPGPAQLAAVDLDRGTIRWRLEAATEFTPATGGGLVFTVNEQTIEARSAADGSVKWRSPLPGGAAAPLYWDTGWLLASTPAGDLAAFRADDGTLVWRRQLGAPLLIAPGPALDRLFLPLADQRLVAVLLATGETVWERKLDAPITALLALEDQLVFGTATKNVTSVDLRRGRERWTWRIGGDMAGAPTADDRHIYFASRDNILRAVDRQSGNLRWKADLASRPAGGPLLIADAVVMPLVSSLIVGFDPVSGKPTVTATAAGEIGLQPYVRRDVRRTLPQLITVSREGQLQGFGRRFEPIPQLLTELPGLPAVP
jgi:outer membrane protein assembly factor BamB